MSEQRHREQEWDRHLVRATWQGHTVTGWVMPESTPEIESVRDADGSPIRVRDFLEALTDDELWHVEDALYWSSEPA